MANATTPPIDAGAATAGDSYVPTSGNGGYSVVHYDLELDYRVNTNRLAGTATISADATQQLSRFSLDLVGLEANHVQVNGARAAKFTQSNSKLIITAPRTFDAGERFTVVVKYGGAPASRKSQWGEIGWEELSDGVLVASQPIGAPTWFPCNDHPSDKATLRVAITLASRYRAVANGRLVSSVAKASRTRWTYEAVEPMASYLATLQIGVYTPRSLVAGPAPQVAYLPDDLPEFDADFGEQPAMMLAFEKLFGPYPFDHYTVVVADDDLEIPLEAQGLSIFGRNHVDGDRGSNRLIAHELAHSWFGNSLTVGSWKDIWLHEGFACYAEWLWSEASGGPKSQRIAEQQWARLRLLPPDIVIGDPGPAFMFDDRVYKRGALTLHAVRLTLGDATFFRMLRAWTDAHRHGTVSTEMFIEHVAGHSSSAIRPVIEAWLFALELPRLPKAGR